MATLIGLKNGYDSNHNDIGLRDPSQSIDGFALAANVSERIAIPAGAARVIISATANIAVKFGTVASSAAMPTDVTDGTGSELNPAGYLLDNLGSGVTHLCVISDTTCLVSLAWYKAV